MKTVIYHSADYDGIFCREIARHFLGDEGTQLIGWNFGDPPVPIPEEGTVYVMDLPVDEALGFDWAPIMANTPSAPSVGDLVARLVWIDHHKTSIESHPTSIPGYRIDGVAACRLAWQWFSHACKENPTHCHLELPAKQDFINRKVSEPLAVRLAGEYDVWDKRDWRAEVHLKPCQWDALLSDKVLSLNRIVERGIVAQGYGRNVDASICNALTWIMEWEGLKWLCVNHARFNSLLFAAKDKPETGHDALLGFRFDGKHWMVSLYHAAHRKDLDLSKIAVKYAGGGHPGACGFTCKTLPFNLNQ